MKYKKLYDSVEKNGEKYLITGSGGEVLAVAYRAAKTEKLELQRKLNDLNGYVASSMVSDASKAIADIQGKIQALDKTISDAPKVSGIEVFSMPKNQKITQKFIDEGISDGTLSMSKGKITIHAKNGDIELKIITTPGHYCCHDGEKLGGEKAAREYVELNYQGVESPDRFNISGYCKKNYFFCEVVGAA